MTLELAPYREQSARWPQTGRHILAQYDDDEVVVYQAYRPAIGNFASEHNIFGGEFSLGRMSWIKPNFLWMMFRSGWGTKPGQEVVLAVHIDRSFFEDILSAAVHSTFVSEVYATNDEWKRHLSRSSVRLQWDPDHGPRGGKLARRAIQLGLRGDMLRCYAQDRVREIEDVSTIVAKGRSCLSDLDALLTPRERCYQVGDPKVASRLGVSTVSPSTDG